MQEAREMPSPVGEVVETVDEVLEKPRLTYFQLFRLTISFAGVQFACMCHYCGAMLTLV